MPGLQHRWEEEEGEEEEEKEEEGCILRSMPSDPHACLLSGPPLVNSSSCAMGNKTTEIRVKYENILSYDINELVNMSAEYRDRCCKNKKHENTKMFFCNDTQEIESLQSMACNMLRFFHKQKISKDFRWKAALVSCGTLQVLQCKCERHKKEKKAFSLNGKLRFSSRNRNWKFIEPDKGIDSSLTQTYSGLGSLLMNVQLAIIQSADLHDRSPGQIF
ncbi:hypothetical protein Q9966_009726 [Columba livia]|nr:hypothetical protein Q9966_009726 [Columba livia]